MNRTYFGDTRDLFKFDLVRHIMKALPGFSSFTFVPMLTDTAGKESKGAAKDLEMAKRKGRAGSQNSDLVSHMERLQEIDDDLEYFQSIRDYFRRENIIVDVMHKRRFSQKNRTDFFNDVLSKLPKKTLIFLDPDTGLEESSPSEQHLLFGEVRKIYDRMDDRSIMMIYQHFPRVRRKDYVKRRCVQLCDLTGENPVTITDNEVIFFLMTKNPRLSQKLQDVLEVYASTYPVLDALPCSE